MPKTARKKAALEGPKFNIGIRYEKLNDDQKKLMKAEFEKTFGFQERAFYKTLRKDVLTDEELQFFAAMYGCTIPDLFRQKPPIRPTVYDLERKYDKRIDLLGKQTKISI
ncbi:hypothetical protein [Adhaeribacter pallidiroseus]|uniref:Uncharacterized protein n=1 Tax=Adhaeribacter pallidiroseus TaxID=2072847 RepID=A0A369QKC8_9BACT|nr:hypothetical protein [Adhaeribacter pallidiroseus]RDC63309.1 hypothetical protein AHMF7616_01911 [Adhaeribacter pallidiroseus]